jgi:hypothetical protein
MAIDRDYLIQIGPEFTPVPLLRMNFIIDIARRFINFDFWPPEQVDFAWALFALHILSIGNLGGAIGLGSKRAGDLSITYTTSALTDPLASTSYGLLLLEIMRCLVITPMVVGASPSPWNYLTFDAFLPP